MMWNDSLKGMLKQVWKQWSHLVVSNKWIDVCAWMLYLTLGVKQAVAKAFLQGAEDLIVEAKAAHPGKGQGDAKWEYVLAGLKERFSEWFETYGKQKVGLIVEGLICLFGAQGKET